MHQLPRFELRFYAENRVAKTFWGRVKVENASSFLRFSHENMVQKLLHEFKYKNDLDLGLFLGKQMALDLKKFSWSKSIECIIPVPLHPKKELQRGFNQSAILVRGMITELRCTAFEENVVRLRNNSSQTKKARFARHVNTKQLFEVKDSSLFENKHVLLIDDVITTGATLESMITCLKEIDGIKISVYTLAVAT